MIKVLLVDDHSIVRSGIRSLIENDSEIEVVAEADNGEDAIEKVKSHSPDVVLMDVNMPGMGGVEATAKICKKYDSIKVIALTSYGDGPVPKQLFKAGAKGYITKDCSVEEILSAIRAVCAGKKYIATDVAQNLALSGIGGGGDVFEKLTSREFQIVMMLIEGQSTQDISEILHLSPKTIHTYKYRVFDKLRLKNDVELTRMAMKHGLI